jgi:hypothetical protein
MRWISSSLVVRGVNVAMVFKREFLLAMLRSGVP